MRQTLRDIRRILSKVWPVAIIMGILHWVAGVPIWIAMLAGLIEIGLWSVVFALIIQAAEAFEQGRSNDYLAEAAVAAVSPEAAQQAATDARVA